MTGLKFLALGALAVVALSFLLSRSSHSVADATFDMSAAELKRVMAAGDGWVILDVRMPEELSGVHGQIPGVINIPVQVLAQHLDKLETYRTKKIAVICRSGNRSVHATKLLQSKKFSARNVLGGMKAYNKLPK